ncbi:FMRFamide receptor-like [Saccostrea echinata]|uniref:FMRFamide receptor-like n=1 Tax=Saccostrea echinata TaxID=191078 RepID=UPI002A823B6E|nr:FMRFamide receptor-like [Saccostrea echinata]
MTNETSFADLNCSALEIGESNSTFVSIFSAEEAEILETMNYYCYRIIIPTVCSFGILGNILNVIIFTKKKNTGMLDEVEYCTTICLVSLAVSDLMFCITTIPVGFQTTRQTVFHKSEFLLYYYMYNSAIISMFIFSSTMLTVLTALMRYLAICHPFRSRQFISIKNVSIGIFVVALFSIAFNLVSMWHFTTVDCIEKGYTIVQPSSLFMEPSVQYTVKLLWAVFGNFIPLSILLFCNIQLIRALRQSRQLRLLHSRDDTSCLSAHRRINITLVTIIIFFFILVAPSEITKFISLLNNDRGFRYAMVSYITNTLQCINFSVNFVLYYVIIAPFRHTLHEFLCSFPRAIRHNEQRERSSANTGKQPQTVMLLSIKDKHHI